MFVLEVQFKPSSLLSFQGQRGPQVRREGQGHASGLQLTLKIQELFPSPKPRAHIRFQGDGNQR